MRERERERKRYSRSSRSAKQSPAPALWTRCPYCVFKNCPSLLPALLRIFITCWSSASVPAQWKVGVLRLLGKEAAKSEPGVLAADNAALLAHSVGPEVQGQLVHDFPGKPADLPECIFKFALNAATDTLTHITRTCFCGRRCHPHSANSAARSNLCTMS